MGFQRTSVYNGEYESSYFALERAWKNAEEMITEPNDFAAFEPSIPEVLTTEQQSNPSSFQRFLRRLLNGSSRDQGGLLVGQRTPEPRAQVAQNEPVGAPTTSSFIKKVVLKLNG